VRDLDDVVLDGVDAGTLSIASAIRALSRPAAMNGTLYSRRYSQTRRPV
jgi:hypothetical protein